MQEDQKVPGFQLKRAYKKSALVTLEVMGTHTLAPTVLPFMEAPLDVLFCCGSEICCRMLLNFFHGRKTITSEPNFESREVREITRSEIWRTWWLGGGWNFVRKGGRCDRVHCHILGSNCFSTPDCVTLMNFSLLLIAPQTAHSGPLSTLPFPVTLTGSRHL
jgi:hypothetical protein